MKRNRLAIANNTKEEGKSSKTLCIRPIQAEEPLSSEDESSHDEEEEEEEETQPVPRIDNTSSIKKRIAQLKKIVSKLEQNITVLCEENGRLSCPIQSVRIDDEELESTHEYRYLSRLYDRLDRLKKIYNNELNIRIIGFADLRQSEEITENSQSLLVQLNDNIVPLRNEILLLEESNTKLQQCKRPSLWTRLESMTDKDISKLSNDELKEFNSALETSKAKIDKKLQEFLP